MMRLAGLNITDDCALELVRRLRCADFAHQADTIRGSVALGALTPEEAALTHRSSPLRSRLSARGRS